MAAAARGGGLIETLPALDGRIVTSDAPHCQKPTARLIVEKGGDYLVQIKANQPALLAQNQAFEALPALLLSSKPQVREQARALQSGAVSQPRLQRAFCSARSASVSRRGCDPRWIAGLCMPQDHLG